MRALLAALLLSLAAGQAGAEGFRVLLGPIEIGAVEVVAAGEELSLRSRFDNTPLALADGTYDADSRPAATLEGEVVRQFLSRSRFTTGTRDVSVLHHDGAVLAVDVQPEAERSEMSDIAALPPVPMLDPVQVMAAVVGAGGCPGPLRFFDGRRVVDVAVAPAPPPEEGGTVCEGEYRVVAGPAHLSPLGIRRVRLALVYDAGGALAEIVLRAGPFALRIVR